MAAAPRSQRFRLETKVMVAVLAVLVALPSVTLWKMTQGLRAQMQRDAELALSTGRGAFVQALKMQTKELGARFRLGFSNREFMEIVRLNDAPTMKDHLSREILDVFHDDTELALFFRPDGELFAFARRGAAEDDVNTFAASAGPLVRQVLQGEEESAGTVASNGMAYQAVAVPVVLPDRGIAGALVFGIRISDAALSSVRPPSTEILVLADNRIAASTLKEVAQNDGILQQLAAVSNQPDEMIRIAGQRFKPAIGVLDPGATNGEVRYVVLSSTEQQLGAFERTRFALLSLSGAGILVSAGVVWFFVRRITRPLVELRDSAEAVGRGDFSHRIERFSNDECGELAEAFNRMTANLQTSRAELERAMQQVKQTQEQLIQSEKLSAVGQFVAGVAHELNNPLTAVVGFSELLQTTETDPKTRSHLDRITKSAHRCHKIVHSLLSFARQHPPERMLVHVNMIIDEVLDIMAYDFRTSNVTIVREFAPDLPAIMGDAHQLQQVFINILANARQAIEPAQRAGSIAIRTRRSDETVIVEFEDNGPGIKAEHLAHIFDPFFTTKPVGKGTGLGLSLCYGIIQEHGGRITARSEPGQGARFAIELPAAGPAEVAPAAGGQESSIAPFRNAQVPPSGRSVLVIDDEQWILDLAGELLRAEGHTVELATGGERALESIGRRQFDVIVSDWKMPGLNGVHLYEHLLATDPRAAKRVLFMTGDVVNDTFQGFLRKHGLTCLSKPFAAREFRAAVSKIFNAVR